MTASPGGLPAPSNTVRPAEKGERNGVRRRLVSALVTTCHLRPAVARRVVDERIALGETLDEIEAYLCSTFRMDPTGVTAVRNVSRGGGSDAA